MLDHILRRTWRGLGVGGWGQVFEGVVAGGRGEGEGAPTPHDRLEVLDVVRPQHGSADTHMCIVSYIDVVRPQAPWKDDGKRWQPNERYLFKSWRKEKRCGVGMRKGHLQSSAEMNPSLSRSNSSKTTSHSRREKRRLSTRHATLKSSLLSAPDCRPTRRKTAGWMHATGPKTTGALPWPSGSLCRQRIRGPARRDGCCLEASDQPNTSLPLPENELLKMSS